MIYENVGVVVRCLRGSAEIGVTDHGLIDMGFVEGKHMFYGDNPDGKGYSTRAHLAEVVGMLGLPPLDSARKEKAVARILHRKRSVLK